MWVQNTETHHSVPAAPQHTKLATLRGSGATPLSLFGLHHGGNDVIQKVGEAALQFVTLTGQRAL